MRKRNVQILFRLTEEEAEHLNELVRKSGRSKEAFLREMVRGFLDSIENQHLYHVLIKVDRLTLQIALMKVQGYSTREIAMYLDITEKAVYRRMDRLKEKLKKFFE